MTTLQKAHIRYNEEANAISWWSDGQIDLRKTGSYTMTSLRFFQDVTRAPRKAIDLRLLGKISIHRRLSMG